MPAPVIIVTGVSRGIGRAIADELQSRGAAVVGAVAFLALPDSDYITGQLVAVDGGYLAQGLSS
jgi:NAD(P)-dependent dehydrogenase (short-subunit alcohol dehydrogenase family)